MHISIYYIIYRSLHIIIVYDLYFKVGTIGLTYLVTSDVFIYEYIYITAPSLENRVKKNY